MNQGSDQDDKAQFANMDDKQTLRRIRRKIINNWHYNAPLFLCAILFVVLVAAIASLAVQVENLKLELNRLQPPVQEPTAYSRVYGTTYIRWGSRSCDGSATLIYKGFVASSSEEMQGGGVDYKCMPPDPEWNEYDLSNDTLAYSWMYGTEYFSYSLGIFPDDAHGRNVPCSVCYAPRIAKVMIPARRTCPDGWTKEYEGYLMSSAMDQRKKSYECVDQHPEYLDGMQNVTGGSQFYFVSGNCEGDGSFGQEFCPPYVHAREITCVLCTK